MHRFFSKHTAVLLIGPVDHVRESDVFFISQVIFDSDVSNSMVVRNRLVVRNRVAGERSSSFNIRTVNMLTCDENLRRKKLVDMFRNPIEAVSSEG